MLRGLQANGSGAARSSEPRGLGGPEGAELLETRGELEEALLEVERLGETIAEVIIGGEDREVTSFGFQ